MEETIQPAWQNINIWVPFAAALIGGLLSLIGSLCATLLAARAARKNQEKVEERIGASNAYETMFKLLDSYNSVTTLKKHIDDMFLEADEAGNADIPPWAKVKILVGASAPIETIAAHETLFLIENKRADLINEVHLIQKRLENIIASSLSYNALRGEIQSVFEASMIEAQLEEGTMVTASIDAKKATFIEMREVQLNSLLGQIMQFLEDDIPKCMEIIKDFRSEAMKRYGDYFPKFSLEIPDIKSKTQP